MRSVDGAAAGLHPTVNGVVGRDVKGDALDGGTVEAGRHGLVPVEAAHVAACAQQQCGTSADVKCCPSLFASETLQATL